MRIRYTAYPWVRSRAEKEVQRVILDHGNLRRFRKGELVIEAGNFYPNIAIVISGMLSKSFGIEGNSKNQAMSILLPGAMLGASFFMSRRCSNLAVEAIRDSAIIEVNHQFLEARMCANPSFLRLMMNHFMLDMESDLEGLATLIARTHEECLRLLFKIIIVREKVLPEDGWYQLPINFSHNELSRIIYTTPLTVNRFLLSWKKQGFYFRKGTQRFVHHKLLENISDWKHETDFTTCEAVETSCF